MTLAAAVGAGVELPSAVERRAMAEEGSSEGGRPWRANPLADFVKLGRTGVNVSPMGVGTWAWGDKSTWKWDPANAKSVEDAMKASLATGVNFFDTAEMYGKGLSENLIGEFANKIEGSGNGEKKIVVATKYVPLPWQWNARSCLVQHLKGSLQRLGRSQVDLYQIHGPALTFCSIETLAEALGDAFDQGLTQAVGVSNFNEAQLRKAHKVLSNRGIPLASNQVEYSLLRTHPEASGLLKAADELGVTILAYSPLAMGRLTGKYSAANPPPKNRKFGDAPMAEIEPLLQKMRSIGDAYGKTPAQVALNWCMCKGTIPIPGAKNAKQAEDNAGAMGWRLTEEEVAQLDSLSRVGTTNFYWQHG